MQRTASVRVARFAIRARALKAIIGDHAFLFVKERRDGRRSCADCLRIECPWEVCRSINTPPIPFVCPVFTHEGVYTARRGTSER
jgi:hypothetical protein